VELPVVLENLVRGEADLAVATPLEPPDVAWGPPAA
jgi:hypothetical protein